MSLECGKEIKTKFTFIEFKWSRGQTKHPQQLMIMLIQTGSNESYPDQSHPIGSDRNSSEFLVSDSDTFRHPTTSCRNPIPRIPTTSDEFRSDPTVGLVVLGSQELLFELVH